MVRAKFDVNRFPNSPMNVTMLGVSVHFHFMLGVMQVTLGLI